LKCACLFIHSVMYKSQRTLKKLGALKKTRKESQNKSQLRKDMTSNFLFFENLFSFQQQGIMELEQSDEGEPSPKSPESSGLPLEEDPRPPGPPADAEAEVKDALGLLV